LWPQKVSVLELDFNCFCKITGFKSISVKFCIRLLSFLSVFGQQGDYFCSDTIVTLLHNWGAQKWLKYLQNHNIGPLRTKPKYQKFSINLFNEVLQLMFTDNESSLKGNCFCSQSIQCKNYPRGARGLKKTLMFPSFCHLGCFVQNKSNRT
jgi:hypothetical protein